MVKSMKKILVASWDHRHLNEDKLCCALLQYCNTPSCKDGLSPAQKLFGHPIQDTLPAHRHSFAPEWQKGTQEAEQQVTETLKQSKTFYNIHAHSLPDIHIGSPVALQSQQTKLWNVYGTVVTIGPHHRYYVKTHSGRVLVCNRCFLQRHIPASLQPLVPACHPSTPNQHTSPPANSSPPPASPESTIHTLHSLRPRRPPSRLVEDPNWP